MTTFSDKIRAAAGAKPLASVDKLAQSRRGRRNREKGKIFERQVAAQMIPVLNCPAFGDTLVIRRSSQAERAYEADVMIEAQNAPSWLTDMWIECENAKEPDTKAKLEQAIHDAGKAMLRPDARGPRWSSGARRRRGRSGSRPTRRGSMSSSVFRARCRPPTQATA